MEKFLLTEKPDKITIITAMYARIKTKEWTGNEDEEVKVFVETKEKILKNLSLKNEKIRIEKLKTLEDTKPVEIAEWKKYANENISKLKTVLNQYIESKDVFKRSAHSRLRSQLLKELSNMSADNLTYDNPLASGIICDESELVKKLPQDCQEEFRTGILEMKLDSNSDLRQASESLVKSHQLWKKQKKKRFENKVEYGSLFDERKDIIKFSTRISNALENVWRTQHYAMMASALDQVNEGTYVAEVLAPLLTATFAELPVPKLRALLLELVNMETGRPESDWKKQLSDHNKLARSTKDAFEDFSINGSVKKYGYDELTKIFCLNLKGE
ncbi:11854_t:CDS:2 [Scutellospora calospora]|uniref:11854_t:CDS:1 n=1 Tax=Scutellospora calospora TaxID=85575 RepID=A0ACA9KMY8_9GLOM|nr:11854_t:CDS:2 [Scutellospora calospora]